MRSTRLVRPLDHTHAGQLTALPHWLLACLVLVSAIGCAAPEQATVSGPTAATTATTTATTTPTTATTSTPSKASSRPEGLPSITYDGAQTMISGLPGSTATVLLKGRWDLPSPLIDGVPEGPTPLGAVAVKGEGIDRALFAVLTPPYTSPALIDLPLGFSYDALSPDGARLYLIEHLPPQGSQHYQVRWYDVRANRLDEAIVVDKTVLSELMAGRPVSRSRTTDGALVATLYDNAEHGPFVHLLDTTNAIAQCIDLPPGVPAAGYALGALDRKSLHIVDTTGRVRYTADLASSPPGFIPVP